MWRLAVSAWSRYEAPRSIDTRPPCPVGHRGVAESLWRHSGPGTLQRHNAIYGACNEGSCRNNKQSKNLLQDAIHGLRDVLFNRQPIRVPHPEMTDAITVKDAAKQRLKPGSYVRVQTAGVYKGDLAQVVNVETSGSCMVKVVPRIDLTAMAKRCALERFVLVVAV